MPSVRCVVSLRGYLFFLLRFDAGSESERALGDVACTWDLGGGGGRRMTPKSYIPSIAKSAFRSNVAYWNSSKWQIMCQCSSTDHVLHIALNMVLKCHSSCIQPCYKGKYYYHSLTKFPVTSSYGASA